MNLVQHTLCTHNLEAATGAQQNAMNPQVGTLISESVANAPVRRRRVRGSAALPRCGVWLGRNGLDGPGVKSGSCG